MQHFIPKFAYSGHAAVVVTFVSLAVFTTASHSAEPSAAADANPPASNSATAPSTTTLTDAQIEALLREIGLQHPDAQNEALLREMGAWYEGRTKAAPTPEARPSPLQHSTSRRYWRHSYGHATADRGEATRLMADELRQRGVAVDSARGSRPPK